MLHLYKILTSSVKWPNHSELPNSQFIQSHPRKYFFFRDIYSLSCSPTISCQTGFLLLAFSPRTARAHVLAMLILDTQEKGLCQIKKETERESPWIKAGSTGHLTWNYLTQKYATKLTNKMSFPKGSIYIQDSFMNLGLLLIPHFHKYLGINPNSSYLTCQNVKVSDEAYSKFV